MTAPKKRNHRGEDDAPGGLLKDLKNSNPLDSNSAPLGCSNDRHLELNVSRKAKWVLEEGGRGRDRRKEGERKGEREGRME